jgi:Zn-dependent peptidase ImmA (M78 family)
LILTDDFDEAHATVEEESQFLPFVGGEAAQIELWATAAKRCLGVPASAALDPWAAATRAGIRVLGNEYFQGLDHEIREPLTVASASWSGGALAVGDDDYLVILNPLHDRVRQRTTLAEELTHIVMGHEPSLLDAVLGTRTHNPEVERQAYEVGGAMLLPYGQLFWRVKRKAPCTSVAEEYEVSESFVRYRINRCGLRRMYDKALAA